MKSKVNEYLPTKLANQIKNIGHHIQISRKKRGFRLLDMAQRSRISVQTLQRIEKGDPKVSFGAYSMCLHILGLSQDMDIIAAPEFDELGQHLTEKSLPKRIRIQKKLSKYTRV